MNTFLKALFFIILATSFNSCENFDSKKLSGKYQLDHPVLKSNINYDFDPILKINVNHTFELKKDILIKGSWDIINYEGENAIISFKFKNHNILAKYNRNIFYFEYPNDFDNGAFSSMLYVKLNH